MRNALKLLLASAFLAASGAASAQSVTVVLNDNTMQKFSTDRVKAITLTTPASDIPVAETNSVAVQVYGNNATLQFSNADKSVVVELDVYGPADANYLHPGTYTVKSGGEPFTIDGAGGYTSFKIDGTKHDITAGSMDVAIRGREYVFNGAFTLDNGSEQGFSFTGKLPTYTQFREYAMSNAGYNENPQQPGVFYVKMNDSGSNIEMALVLSCASTATSLQAGTYVRATDATVMQPGTYGAGSYIDLFRPYYSDREFTGPCTIDCKDGIYSIDFEAHLSNGLLLAITYEGEIKGTPTFVDPAKEAGLKKGPSFMPTR